MGYSSWSSSDWDGYASKTSTKSAREIFTSTKLNETLDPTKFKLRESRDSDAHPNSTAVIIAVDVTGSMGVLAENLVKSGLGVVFGEIIDRKPVSDPHVMVMAVGDAYMDRSPIQVSQFETDLTIATHLEKVHVEGGGGGNGFESYELPYYIAAFRTSIDCMEKRNKRGYLFTIGDEPPPPALKKDQVKQFTGDTLEADIPFKDLISIASRSYNCYHIIIKEGSHVRMRGLDDVLPKWRDLMGQNAVVLDDINALSETIVSIIQVNEGASVDAVSSSWSGNKGLVVRSAIKDLTTSDSNTTGLATL